MVGSTQRFLAELKRRRVLGVVAGYLVGAWVLIQVAETTFPYLGLPPWTITLIIVVGIAGLPAAALLAWTFDITRFGIETTQPVPDERPDARTMGEPPPTPLGSLVGREHEMERVESELRESTRLLTITGPGGSGKTRLALEVAHRLAPDLGLDVAWVPLAAVRDPALVPSEIGAALGVGERRDEELRTTLVRLLRDTDTLLVLDNFEQVVTAAPFVASLVGACSGLRVLTTSRSRLRLNGERELPLAPLAIPEPASDSHGVLDSPAVRLFVERAREVNPGFGAGPDAAATLAAICRRLDGLPLALELAAARAKVLEPSEMLERLERRLPLLGQGTRDGPAHQRTLRQAIEWSYDLLRPEEQSVFVRLASFVEGATLEAIEAVVAPGLDGVDLLLVVEALVDQSLAARRTTAGTSRFVMLEVIREYAAERLRDSGDDEHVRDRHAAHFAEVAAAAEPELAGGAQTEWLDRLDREQENLRAALRWLESRDPASALRLAIRLRRYWEMRGYLSEGRRILETLLRPVQEGKLRAKALYAAGVLADAQGDYGAARARFEEALALHREAGDDWGVANGLNNLGVVALRYGDHARARRLFEKSLAQWRSLGNDAAIALALDNLGNAARLEGKYPAAREYLESSLAMHRSAGDANGCGLTLGLLGQVARDEGDLEGAERLHERSLELFRQGGNRPQAARSLLELGSLRHARGAPEEARASYAQALESFAELGDPRGLADTLDGMVDLAMDNGDEAHGRRLSAAARSLRERPRSLDLREVRDLVHPWALQTDAS